MGVTTRKTEADYHALAQSRGFAWAGSDAPASHTKTLWRCVEGHEWESSFHNIKQGSDCPVCSRRKLGDLYRKTSSDYHALAVECGIQWGGGDVQRTNQSTEWRCPQGHVWQCSYNYIAQHRCCIVCKRETRIAAMRLTTEDYHALAKRLGFEWIGELPKKNSEHTTWRCAVGHTWRAGYNTLQGGNRCPYCSQPTRKGAEAFEEVAEARGFTWLGVIPEKAKGKTGWMCSKGHRWQARIHNIRMGSGCPACVDMIHGAFTSKPQRKLHQLLGGELNYPVGRYSLDVALFYGDVKIDAEYDCWYWHQHKVDHDKERDATLIAAGWRILRIKTNTKFPTAKQLKLALGELMRGASYAEIVLPDWGGS